MLRPKVYEAPILSNKQADFPQNYDLEEVTKMTGPRMSHSQVQTKPQTQGKSISRKLIAKFDQVLAG